MENTNTPPKLPAGVDFSVQEALTAGQLQMLLRQDFNGVQLSKCTVEVISQLAPWDMKITGGLEIYGQVHVWEAVIDVRNIERAEDFLLLVKQLHRTFDQAAEKLKGSN